MSPNGLGRRTPVPIYAGVRDVSPYYKNYDDARFSEDSARWAVDFVEKLLHLRWQEAVKYLTNLTISRMNVVVKMFKSLRDLLLTTYSGDIV
jgi:dipeptidase